MSHEVRLSDVEKELQRRAAPGQIKKLATDPAPVDASTEEEKRKAAIDEFLVLVDKISAAKTEPANKDLQALRAGFRKWPEIFRVGGNMAHQTRFRIIKDTTSEKDYITKEAMWASIEALQNDLGYQNAPPLEKLLIEQIVNCWLAHYINENKYGGVLTQGVTLSQGEYWEHRITASQKRYLRAMEMLARIRRLGSPQPAPVQVNIAEKQVNVGNLTA